MGGGRREEEEHSHNESLQDKNHEMYGWKEARGASSEKYPEQSLENSLKPRKYLTFIIFQGVAESFISHDLRCVSDQKHRRSWH